MTLAAYWRRLFFKKAGVMTESYYDVVVVGGGIHGVGVAQAAAANGYTVLLLEQSAIGACTSSKSSKLIHGGLRYLESFQFGLVKECLRERAILLANAPELVKLVPFYIPVYKETLRRPWKIKTGLWLYRMLDGLRDESRFRTVAQDQWTKLTGLRQQNLQCVFQYYDAQTDDLELTRAVLHSAQQLGAEALVPARLVHAEIEKHGCVLSVSHNDLELSYQCAVLVNAAGPWVNEVLKNCKPTYPGLDIEYVQGTHIVVGEPAKTGVFYLEALQDRRAIFVIPWKNQTMIGTTETVFTGDPREVKPQQHEISYLRETYNYYFPGAAAGNNNIVDAFAGLRVLPSSANAPFSRSRDTRLLADNEQSPRLISMYGGKLTAYRSTAERVMQLAGRGLPDRKQRAQTRSLPLKPVG